MNSRKPSGLTRVGTRAGLEQPASSERGFRKRTEHYSVPGQSVRRL